MPLFGSKPIGIFGVETGIATRFFGLFLCVWGLRFLLNGSAALRLRSKELESLSESESP